MEFTWPSMLIFLLLVPGLAGSYVWLLRRRARFALRYSSLLTVREAGAAQAGIKRHVPPLLFLLSVGAMLFALARPVTTVALAQPEKTVILAIDESGSMGADDLKPNRLAAAKAAARAFVQQQDASTRIGIVAFSTTASLVQAPTKEHDQVFAAINRLDIEQSTAIGSAILESLDAIFGQAPPAGSSDASSLYPDAVQATPEASVAQGAHAPAVIVLLTDGENTIGPSPLGPAGEAAQLGVRIFTIGIGTAAGAELQAPGNGVAFHAELDEKTLEQIANMTGAMYFHAADEAALETIYKSLGTEITARPQKTEVTALFTALAAVLALAASGLALRWTGSAIV